MLSNTAIRLIHWYVSEGVTCHRPNVDRSVIVTGMNFGFGNEVGFGCRNGYTLMGEKRSICLADGTWDVTTANIHCRGKITNTCIAYFFMSLLLDREKNVCM